MTSADGQGFADSFPFIRVKGRTDETPYLEKQIRCGSDYRHPESGGHVDKKRCCQIDIYQLDFKLTGKEVIGKVECLSDVPQKMVKDEIVVAGEPE